jgi:hypothetical protein
VHPSLLQSLKDHSSRSLISKAERAHQHLLVEQIALEEEELATEYLIFSILAPLPRSSVEVVAKAQAKKLRLDSVVEE